MEEALVRDLDYQGKTMMIETSGLMNLPLYKEARLDPFLYPQTSSI